MKSNLLTGPRNDTLIFGCATHTSGPLSSSPSNLDGILGFGPSNVSMLSQLAASGKVKRKFSHCFDSINGGGIFSIGEVVAPKLNTTPLLFMSQPWYVVVMKDVEVDGEAIQVRNGIATIIDSGTTLAYLTASVHDKLVTKILARQPGLKSHLLEDQYTCFNYYSNNLDDGFPVVNLHFEGLYLTVYPHDCMFLNVDDEWCIGWLRSSEDGPIILGDLVLSNRLVVYDLEKMAIGWTDYNCSTSIEVKDDKTGSVYTVGAKHLPAEKHLSSASTMLIGRILTFFFLLIALLST